MTRETIQPRHSAERGFTLVELLISLLILAVAMGGITIMLSMALETNNKSGHDTASTMVAEHVLEEISSEPANSNSNRSITDCAGNVLNITTTGAALGVNGGAGARVTASNAPINPGVIDWTQTFGNVPAGYAIRYVGCGVGGSQTAYEVRWNVATLTPYTRLVVISARPVADIGIGVSSGLRFVVPPNLRTINGM
jgi:prepilin-type N-terminal cleavage/methylation domain-containing protein